MCIRDRFICSPPQSPTLGAKRPPVVTPDAKPRPYAIEALPPALSLDGSPRTKRIKFYSSLSAVREEGPAPAGAAAAPCGNCGSARTTACRGRAFERSDLDYFEPCAHAVCLDCDAPPCGSCGSPITALPFCKACLEMVVYEAVSYTHLTLPTKA